jgi:hypothetical protein
MRLKTSGKVTATAQASVETDTPWTRWLRSMQENTHELEEAVERGDLESGLKLAAARGHLIYDQLPRAWRFALMRDEVRTAKRFLEEVVLENRNLIERLVARCREQTEELKTVKRGRKALRLYRNPPATTPRFLDRLG